MYESYFSFRRKPFSILPDASFLYLSKKHKLALTVLRYGLDSHALITVVTGDIGCGKTTLVRKLIGEARDDITIGLITNTHSAFGDPLKLALLAFDLKYEGKTNTERYETLVDFIINEYAQRRHTVLIVDEAQNLDESALEELRMLSNINVDSHHILQLVLLGQPELRDTLNQPELKQFAQRVSADYHILPLSAEEMAAYIQHRLKVVEGDPHIFLPETYPLIHEHSSGVPRLVNILCDTALVYAYGSEKKQIDAKLIKEVIKHRESGVYFRGGPSTSAKPKGVQSSKAVRARSIISISNEKPVAASEDRASMEMAFDRHDDLGAKERTPSVKKTPAQEKTSVKPQDEKVQEAKQKTPGTAQSGQSVKRIPKRPDNADLGAGGSSEKTGVSKPTFSSIQPPIRKAVKSNKESVIEITDTAKPWGRKVAVSAVALVLSIGALYLYQNPSTFDAFKQRIEHAQIQSLLTESKKYLEADQLMEPVGANAHEVLYKVFERDPNNAAAQEQLAEIKDKFFAISMQIQGVASESKRFLKSKEVEVAESENAYEAFSKILASAPGDTDAQAAMDSVKDNLFSVAISVQNQGNWDQARSQLQALLRISPQSERAQKLLATVDEAQAAELAETEAQSRIDNWLSKADKHLEANQLTNPEGESAITLFNKVLEQDSVNTTAKAGIEKIKDQLFGNATNAHTEGNWDLARSQLQSLMKISPQSKRGQKLLATVDEAQAAEQAKVEAKTRIQSWLAQADDYVKAGQLTSPEGDNALALLNKVLEQDSTNNQAKAGIEKIKDQLFANANTAQAKGNWVQARSQLQALMIIETNSERGQKLLETVDEAQAAEQAKTDAQTRIDNWLTQSDEYLKVNQIISPEGDNAIALLNKVLAQDASNQRALASIEKIKNQLFNNATLAQTKGDLNQARSQLQALMQISPQSERGQKLLTTVDEAHATEKAEAEAQTRLENWLVQADEYLKANRLTEPKSDNAYALFKKVLEQDSANAIALAGIGKIKDQLFSAANDAHAQGDWDQARDQLQALMRIESNNGRGEQLLAAVNDAQATEQAEAEAQLQIESWLVQAYEYIKTGQLMSPEGDNAYSLFSQVLKQDASNRQALSGIKLIKNQLLTAANDAQAQGDWDQARDQLQALMQIESNNVRAQKLLAEVDEAQAAKQAEIDAQARIDNWLAQAGEYLKVDKIISPQGDNAYVLFNKVLEQDSVNTTAKAGIEKIKNQLFNNATKAQAQRNWDQARKQLRALMQIEASSKRGQKLLATVDEAQAAEQASIDLQTRIDNWLAQAEEYVKVDQLTTPNGENAYALFSKVLGQDAGNEQAQSGIERIKDQLFGNAMKAQTSSNWEQARSQLRALLQISPQSERGQKLLATVDEAQSTEQVKIETQTRIDNWLAQADAHVKANQLTTPDGENAYALFNNVLEQDAGNKQAQSGIEQIKDQLFGNASAAQTSGNWEQARSQLQALMQISPQSERGQKLLAKINETQVAEQADIEAQTRIDNWLVQADEYVKANQLTTPNGENAYALFNNVLEQDAGNKQAQSGIEQIEDQLFGNASAAQTSGNWEQARSQLQALMQISPQSERGQKLLAKINETQAVEQANIEAQTKIESWLSQAEEYIASNQLVTPEGENAYALFTQVLQLEANNKKALEGIGAIEGKLFVVALKAQQQGDWDLARRQLEALIRIDSQNKQSQRALLAVNKAQADEQAQFAAQIHIRDWLDKAKVHFDNGELLKPAQNNAYENFYKVLEQSPDDATALAGMQAIKDLLFEQSVTLQKQGDWEKARNQLQALIQIEPQSERGWEALEKLTVAQQEQEAERAQIQTWLKKAHERARNGQLLKPVGANALELFSKILEYAPENVDALAGMELVKSQYITDAEAAQSQGNWGVARGKLWALLQIDSQNEAATRALTDLAAAQKAADIAAAEPDAAQEEQAEINQPIETTPPTDQSEIDQELLDIFQSGGAGLPLPQVTE